MSQDGREKSKKKKIYVFGDPVSLFYTESVGSEVHLYKQ